MSFLVSVYNTILYRPLLNILVLLYQYLPGRDLGIVTIILTILIRFILHPLISQSIKSQKALAEIQPKLAEIQKTYKDDQEKQAKEIMALYKKEKVNPFKGFFLLLIQLPIIITIYQVFRKGLESAELNNLYSFVPHPGAINPMFLGLINLSQSNWALALLAGIAQFFQLKMIESTNKKPETKENKFQFSDILQKQMLFVSVFFTFFILLKLPSIIALYWLVTSLITIVQQHFVFKKNV